MLQHRANLIILLVAFFPLFSQTYKWEASMADSVSKDGFYNIILQPEVGAKLNRDFSDIRILDSENYQVPYIRKGEEHYFTEERFKEYPVVSKQVIENCCTKLVIKNTDRKAINNICLILKNSDAVKVTRVSGSDDGVNWYGVQRYDVFYNNYNASDTRIVNYINFPLTDYQYFQLEILDRGYWDEERWVYWYSDRWSYPVNILKVGYYESLTREGKYTKVPSPVIAQGDSTKEKKTYVKINFADNYFTDRIRFQFSGPRYYKRQAMLARRIKNKKVPDFFEPISVFELNSYSLNEFHLKDFREKEVYLVIENEDNRPLKLGEIETWQLTQYLKTYLEKGKKYRLVYGDTTAVSPVYDLRFFADSIPEIVPTLPIATIAAASIGNDQIRSKGQEKEVRWFENKIFIWIAIALVTVLLFLMCWKMLKEMKTGS